MIRFKKKKRNDSIRNQELTLQSESNGAGLHLVGGVRHVMINRQKAGKIVMSFSGAATGKRTKVR